MHEQLVEILLVEDNLDDIRLAMHAFRAHNFANRVHVIRDGEEAVAFLQGLHPYEHRTRMQAPRVVLLDLKLPKLDGIEVLRRLKSHPASRDIPVVVLTSSREERDVVESYRLGVNSYIVKPVEFEAFLDVVKSLGFYWLLLNQAPLGAPGGRGGDRPESTDEREEAS
jgi:two-component system response regulator